jgi:hypothetical protein
LISLQLKASSLIASDLKDEPSPIDQIEALGEEAANFVNMNSLRSYAIENLPPAEAINLLSKRISIESITQSVRDLLESVDFSSEPQDQIIWIPTWEIHKPKVEGCTATLKKSSSHSKDYSLNIKVFGVGGGLSKSRSVGLTQTIQAEGECLQVILPITITTQTGTTKKGQKITRVSVKDIGVVPSTKELTGNLDRCGVFPDALEKSGWENHKIEVAPKATQGIQLSIVSSQGAELSFGTTILGMDIGIKAVLKLQKELAYSYKLVGHHSYFCYFPKNSIAWYWTLLPP